MDKHHELAYIEYLENLIKTELLPAYTAYMKEHGNPKTTLATIEAGFLKEMAKKKKVPALLMK